jgi:hypothetical protein
VYASYELCRKRERERERERRNYYGGFDGEAAATATSTSAYVLKFLPFESVTEKDNGLARQRREKNKAVDR